MPFGIYNHASQVSPLHGNSRVRLLEESVSIGCVLSVWRLVRSIGPTVMSGPCNVGNIAIKATAAAARTAASRGQREIGQDPAILLLQQQQEQELLRFCYCPSRSINRSEAFVRLLHTRMCCFLRRWRARASKQQHTHNHLGTADGEQASYRGARTYS
jgi:hypothetical protein